MVESYLRRYDRRLQAFCRGFLIGTHGDTDQAVKQLVSFGSDPWS
jgi:hypothetical protein